MKKVILIMDEPEKCDHCPCFRIINDYEVCEVFNAKATEKYKGYNSCPLKHLPEKKVVLPTDNTGAVAVKYGWNECIEEILE